MRYFFSKTWLLASLCLFACQLTYADSTESAGVPVDLSDVGGQVISRATPKFEDQPGLAVTSHVRAFDVNGVSYPDASLFIPVSFVANGNSRVSAFAHYVNRVRGPRTTFGCQPKCSDAELAFDIVVFANEKRSLTVQPGIQSLTSRNNGTKLGQGGFFGFRFSTSINETLAFSVGGESILRFDSTVDLGTQAYLGFSKLFNLSSRAVSGPLVLNIGLGSGAFSLFGNTLISTGYRSDRPDTIGDPNNFDFGLVGSISFSPLENLTLGLEYSGYGVGFGPSFRPIPGIPMVTTFYIYDLLWTPDELNYNVTPNFFGNLTFQF